MADNLTQDQQNKINALKAAYADAQKRGDKTGMNQAHADAEAIRNQAGFSGGADGSEYIPMQGGNSAQSTGNTSQPSAPSQPVNPGNGLLNAQQQQQIQQLKDAYAKAQAAGDKAAMELAHSQAEAVRNQAGFSGGADGSGFQIGTNPLGGMTAEEMARYVEEYDRANQTYNAVTGQSRYSNGYSVAMNTRSLANKIRQQMFANSQAYNGASPEQKAYLHQQNLELAKILEDATGGARSTFNPQTGRWETANANLGYGINVGGGYDDREFQKNVYGMTDEQIDHYIDDPSRYWNFVDQSVVRNWQNEDNGFTGRYSQFANGPYSRLLGTDASKVPMSEYMDVIGDGFNEGWGPNLGPDGKPLPRPLKNNQFMTDYTRDKLGYIYNGVIQPGVLNSGTPGSIYQASAEGSPQYTESAEHPVNPEWEQALREQTSGGGLPGIPGMGNMPIPPVVGGGIDPGMGVVPGGGSGSFGGSVTAPGGGQYSDYINQMMDANLAAQKAALEQAYKQNTGELDTAQTNSDNAYSEQKRQTAGQSDRDAANWRELAVAQGLNTGAVGQAALAQNNQLQSDLSTLGASQAEVNANFEKQRALLGQKYQYDIIKAQAENDLQRAEMLYKEAVRADEALRQQQQFWASMALDASKAAMSFMGRGMSGGGAGTPAAAGKGRGPRGPRGGNETVEDNSLFLPTEDPKPIPQQAIPPEAAWSSGYSQLSGGGKYIAGLLNPSAPQYQTIDQIIGAKQRGTISQQDVDIMMDMIGYGG